MEPYMQPVPTVWLKNKYFWWLYTTYTVSDLSQVPVIWGQTIRVVTPHFSEDKHLTDNQIESLLTQ
jgi:hypothetical protein